MPWKQPKLTSQEWVVASPHSRTGTRLARVYKEDEQPSPWTAGHLGGHRRSSGTPVAWHPSPSEQRSRRQRSPDCAWLPSERPPSHFWLQVRQWRSPKFPSFSRREGDKFVSTSLMNSPCSSPLKKGKRIERGEGQQTPYPPLPGTLARMCGNAQQMSPEE